MRKYNYDFEISCIDGDIVILRYSRVDWYCWKTRAINVTGLDNEPKYIQKYIQESLGL